MLAPGGRQRFNNSRVNPFEAGGTQGAGRVAFPAVATPAPEARRSGWGDSAVRDRL